MEGNKEIYHVDSKQFVVCLGKTKTHYRILHPFRTNPDGSPMVVLSRKELYDLSVTPESLVSSLAEKLKDEDRKTADLVAQSTYKVWMRLPDGGTCKISRNEMRHLALEKICLVPHRRQWYFMQADDWRKLLRFWFSSDKDVYKDYGRLMMKALPLCVKSRCWEPGEHFPVFEYTVHFEDRPELDSKELLKVNWIDRDQQLVGYSTLEGRSKGTHNVRRLKELLHEPAD